MILCCFYYLTKKKVKFKSIISYLHRYCEKPWKLNYHKIIIYFYTIDTHGQYDRVMNQKRRNTILTMDVPTILATLLLVRYVTIPTMKRNDVNHFTGIFSSRMTAFHPRILQQILYKKDRCEPLYGYFF